jgi:hypothetical protein
MFARKAGRRFRRRHLFKLALITLLACAVLFAYARAQKKSAGAYALAADLPRGALLYAQFSDLPALIKRWDESKLKERYLASTNFQQFQSRHLALKLIERWEEFNNALGFPLDALALGEAAENRAALAVYDIGRLEMVFIAPIGEERLAATRFFQNVDQFEETELPGGTVYYSREVEADRGRRQQKFAFASVRGRLVVATSEPLLLRTLANISGRAKNDRLSDDTTFKTLSAEVTPHFLTIWMNQSKLNDDWYFKHYWIMRNVEQLKNIRACVLDLELQEGKWIEHRNFLLTGQTAVSSSFVPAAAAQRISALIPNDAPYFKLRALDESGGAASLVRDTLMDRLPDEGETRGPGWKWQSYDDSDFYPANDGGASGYGGYYSLDPSFDSLIDDPIDAKVEDENELAHARLRRETERKFVEGLRASIEAARPSYAATVASPQGSTGPLFVEFRRGAVLTLQSHGALNRQAFESAISSLAESRLMITGSGAGLNWTDGHCDAQQQCRLLTLPMLGWTLCYALRGPDLVLANSPELLQAMLDGSSASRPLDSNSSLPFHDLTVIRFDRREQAFDSLMRKLDAPRVKAYWEERRKKEQGDGEGPSQEFFSGNIASLLDVASPVREVRIKRNLLPSRLREEVLIILK